MHKAPKVMAISERLNLGQRQSRQYRSRKSVTAPCRSLSAMLPRTADNQCQTLPVGRMASTEGHDGEGKVNAPGQRRDEQRRARPDARHHGKARSLVQTKRQVEAGKHGNCLARREQRQRCGFRRLIGQRSDADEDNDQPRS